MRIANLIQLVEWFAVIDRARRRQRRAIAVWSFVQRDRRRFGIVPLRFRKRHEITERLVAGSRTCVCQSVLSIVNRIEEFILRNSPIGHQYLISLRADGDAVWKIAGIDLPHYFLCSRIDHRHAVVAVACDVEKFTVRTQRASGRIRNAGRSRAREARRHWRPVAGGIHRVHHGRGRITRNVPRVPGERGLNQDALRSGVCNRPRGGDIEQTDLIVRSSRYPCRIRPPARNLDSDKVPA